MKKLLGAFIFSVLLFIVVFTVPKLLLQFNIFLGGIGILILLLISSIILGVLFTKVAKQKFTDLFSALATLFYIMIFILVYYNIMPEEGMLSSIEDILFISLGAGFMLFISLSVVGKIFEKIDKKD